MRKQVAFFAANYVLLALTYQTLFGWHVVGTAYALVMLGILLHAHFTDPKRTPNEVSLMEHDQNVMAEYKQYRHLIAQDHYELVAAASRQTMWIGGIGSILLVATFVQWCVFGYELMHMVEGQAPRMPLYVPMLAFALAREFDPARERLVLAAASALVPVVRKMDPAKHRMP